MRVLNYYMSFAVKYQDGTVVSMYMSQCGIQYSGFPWDYRFTSFPPGQTKSLKKAKKVPNHYLFSVRRAI